MTEQLEQADVPGKGTKSLLLRQMPKDIHDYLLGQQMELKKSCNCQKSIETTIYSIIRRFKKHQEDNATPTTGPSCSARDGKG